MKTFRFTLFTIAVLLCSISASAHNFEVNGIYYNITSLYNLTIEVTYQGGNSTSYDEYVGDVIIPESVTCNGETYSVTSIGDQAFNGCSGLTSVTIPNSVTSIERKAFTRCSGLTSITIGNSVTTIGVEAFYNCKSLTSITIPNSVTRI